MIRLARRVRAAWSARDRPATGREVADYLAAVALTNPQTHGVRYTWTP